jgi:hypothetical protein
MFNSFALYKENQPMTLNSIENSLYESSRKSTFSSAFNSSQTQSEILAEKLLERVNREQLRISSECKALKRQVCNF